MQGKKKDIKNKIRITFTIDSDLVKKLDKKVSTENFRNRSHSIETAIEKFVKDD